MRVWQTYLCLALAMTGGAPQAATHHPKDDDTTIWGGNMVVVIDRAEPVRSVHGNVLLGDRTVEDALVEVFDHPETVRQGSPRDRTGQRRLAHLWTNKKGRFGFDLPNGDYEVRVSKGPGIDVTSVVIHVRDSGSKKPLEIRLVLGT